MGFRGFKQIKYALKLGRQQIVQPHEEPEKVKEPVVRQIAPQRPKEQVVGGDIKWKPVDKTAAIVVSKAPWWAHPPPPQKAEVQKPKRQKPKPKKRKRMSMRVADEIEAPAPKNGQYISKEGIKIHMVNGQPMMDVESTYAYLERRVAELVNEVAPGVKAAKDARATIDELLHGIGGDMEKFQAATKLYLEDIRATRFAVVTETASMTKGLKEVRQFFLGGDYKEEIARLREFVELCERLQKLKESGFLDKVADTMLTLSVPK